MGGPGVGSRGGRSPGATKIRLSFGQKILSFRSTFRHEIEKSTSIQELADLLIIKNHFMSLSFPGVSTAFLLFVTIPVITASDSRLSCLPKNNLIFLILSRFFHVFSRGCH